MSLSEQDADVQRRDTSVDAPVRRRTVRDVRDLLVDLARRLPNYLRTARGAVLRRPPVVTLILIICIAVTYARLEVGGKLPALRFVADAYSPRAVTQGHFRLFATSTLETRDIFMLVSISYSLLAALGTYEVIAGHARAVIVAVMAAVLGPLLVAGGLGILVAAGSSWGEGRLGTLDIGASAIIAAASGGVAGIVRNRRFTVGLVLFLIGGLIVHHRLADWEHVFIFPFGYAVGRYLGRPKPKPASSPSRRVARYVPAGLAILALSVAGCARLLPAAAVQRNATGSVLSPARLVDTSYPAPSLGGKPRRVLVYLPAGYDSTRSRYPVVDLLHGYPGRPDDFFSLGDLQATVRDPRIAPFIVVMPDANGPHRTDSWLANIPSQKMGSAVSTDLRPWVTKNYRTTGSWSYVGISSGAFAAAYLPLIDPAPVHAVCAFSGYYAGRSLPILRTLPVAQRLRESPIDNVRRAAPITFLAYGSEDIRATRRTSNFAAALRRAHQHVLIRVYPGKHQWAVWRPAFRDCFQTILPAKRVR